MLLVDLRDLRLELGPCPREPCIVVDACDPLVESLAGGVEGEVGLSVPRELRAVERRGLRASARRESRQKQGGQRDDTISHIV